MLIPLYKALMKGLEPALKAYLRRRLRLGKEDPARFNERLGRPQLPREEGYLVWFHAASVGESQSLLALIRLLLGQNPGLRVMVTTGTVTSAKLMAERLPPRAFHQYIPVDHPAWVDGFLDHWRPDLAIWAESELWPNMLMGVQKRGIPAVLLNARMSQASFRRWRRVRRAIGGVLKTFRLCLAQNAAEAGRLAALGAENVKISGNLKYAASPLPFDAEKLAALQKAIGARPRLLWAATHPGEEEVACRIHKALRDAAPGLLSIIVPRHPQRGSEVSGIIAAAGLKHGLRSAGVLPAADDEIYVADTLGETGLFYRLSPLCIIGGSFVPHGGHNPIEPAQLGCQIFYGPHMFNFVSVCEDFESRGAACRAADERELAEKLAPALKDPRYYAGMAKAAQDWALSQAHVAEEILSEISPFLPADKETHA